jgi:hypothetical protein
LTNLHSRRAVASFNRESIWTKPDLGSSEVCVRPQNQAPVGQQAMFVTVICALREYGSTAKGHLSNRPWGSQYWLLSSVHQSMANDCMVAILTDREVFDDSIVVSGSNHVYAVIEFDELNRRMVGLICDRRNLRGAPETMAAEEAEVASVWVIDSGVGERGKELLAAVPAVREDPRSSIRGDHDLDGTKIKAVAGNTPRRVGCCHETAGDEVLEPVFLVTMVMCTAVAPIHPCLLLLAGARALLRSM